MKTRIFAAVLAVLLIVSFCGCDKIFTDYSTSKAGQTESEPDFELNIDRKPDRITILSAFEGGKAGEIVSFLLITLNTDAKTVAVLQIPADTYYSGQVTLADEYRNGLAKEIAQGTQNPVANAMKSVSDLISDSLAVHIDYTAHMTKDQLANVIDTVGGVTLDIPYSIGLDDGSIIKSGRTLLGGSFAAGLVSYNRFSDSFMSELHIHKLLFTAFVTSVKNNVDSKVMSVCAVDIRQNMTTTVTGIGGSDVFILKKLSEPDYGSIRFARLATERLSLGSGMFSVACRKAVVEQINGFVDIYKDPLAEEKFDPHGRLTDDDAMVSTLYSSNMQQPTIYSAKQIIDGEIRIK